LGGGEHYLEKMGGGKQEGGRPSAPWLGGRMFTRQMSTRWGIGSGWIKSLLLGRKVGHKGFGKKKGVTVKRFLLNGMGVAVTLRRWVQVAKK